MRNTLPRNRFARESGCKCDEAIGESSRVYSSHSPECRDHAPCEGVSLCRSQNAVRVWLWPPRVPPLYQRFGPFGAQGPDCTVEGNGGHQPTENREKVGLLSWVSIPLGHFGCQAERACERELDVGLILRTVHV